MRKTKIICSIGPACDNEEILEKMCLAGMNVARLNCSHDTHVEHQAKIDRIKKVREKLGLPIAIMLDTRGPEYRLGCFEKGKVTVREGALFTFTRDPIPGTEQSVSVNYPYLAREMKPGDRILVSNGILVFEVKEISGDDVVCTVIHGGEISDHKSMCFPGKVFSQPYLSEQDKADILFGIRNDVDFLACSFVSTRQDMQDVHDFLQQNGGGDISIIAKIENQSGIDQIQEICELCDGIMVARGDLGTELPFEELPALQKSLIERCRMYGKRVITATEMLESMIHNPRPTRAEVSDVANAVYDGTSAVMLSAETAAGKFPVQALTAMASIVEKTEQSIDYSRRFHDNRFHIKNRMDAISHSVCGMAIDLDASAIVVCTYSGMTARMVSRFRPPVDIIGLCVNEKRWRQLALSWGITPIMSEVYPSMEVLFYAAKKHAENAFHLAAGEQIIVTGGVNLGEAGNTNTIRVETI